MIGSVFPFEYWIITELGRHHDAIATAQGLTHDVPAETQTIVVGIVEKWYA